MVEKKLKRGQAELICFHLQKQENLGQHISKIEICGSIRRKKEFVNDVDLVIITNPEASYQFGQESFNDTVIRLNEKETPLLGKKIKRFWYKNISIDIYIATEETFETLMLIRTGSKEHNIRLTTAARSKGLKLYASGSGLCKVDKDDNIISVVEDTEKGILYNLLGKYVEPENRFE